MPMRLSPMLPALAVMLATLLAAMPHAVAQHARPERIWNLVPGTPVAALPPIFFDIACGTAGGPPSRPLPGIAGFASCPANAEGLHEVAFRYDDTDEYVARARRDEMGLRAALINTIEGQPVILSVLIDAGGILRGYRIYTDPKTDPETRQQAFAMVNYVRARFGPSDWACEMRPQDPREGTVDGLHINTQCVKTADGTSVTLESRLYRKPGQREFDLNGNPTVNEFESWSRVEVMQVSPRDEAIAAPGGIAEAVAEPVSPEARFLAGLSKDCPDCKLAGADLRRRDLSGAELSGADLTGALLHRANLRNAGLAGARLGGANLNLANLTAAKLAGAELDRALLYGARLEAAELTGATLGFALLGTANLDRARLQGAVLDDADLGAARLVRADLTGASLQRSFLFGAAMLEARLDGANAERTNFASADLERASLAGGRFRSADFLGARLVGADLSGSDFRDARLTLANLFQATRGDADFTGALLP